MERRQRADAAHESPRPQAVKLPPLLVRLIRMGRVVREVRIPDPREKFLAAYNELGRPTGDRAEAA